MLTQLVTAIVRLGFWMMLKNPRTYEVFRRTTNVNRLTPKWYSVVVTEASWSLQDQIVLDLGLSRCIDCKWVVDIDQPHIYCVERLKEQAREAKIAAEIEAGWAAFEAEQELRGARLEADFLNEECPCGHIRYFHQFGYNESCNNCNCLAFGSDDYYDDNPDDDDYEYAEPTKVFFGDPGDNCGFIGWE